MATIKKKKKLKVWIIVLIVLLALAAIFVLPRFLLGGKQSIAVFSGDIFEVTPRSVADTISATGLVKSHDDTTEKVYSTLSYKIDSVNVEVGDKVEKDTVLCVYDTETLRRAIKEKELSLSSSKRSASLTLANAKMNYETFLQGIESGTNASINNAKSTYDSALDAYNNAKEDYDDYILKVDTSEVIALNSAKRDLDKAKSDYDEYLKELENGENTSLSIAKRNLDKAKNDYEKLKKEIDEGTNLQLAAAKRSYETALENYEDYKEKLSEDDTAELMQASAALDKAEYELTNAKSVLKTYKTSMESTEEKWLALEEDPTASEAEKINAKNRYDSAKGKYDSQLTTVKRLETQVEAYAEAYDNASDAADMTLKNYKTTYENAKDNYDSLVKSLNDQLETLEKAVLDANDNYNNAKSGTDTQLENYEAALKRAEDAYTNAKDNVDTQTKSYENALTNAKRKLDDATLALSNAEIAAKDQLESYNITYQNAQNGTNTALADYQLANLYEDLGKATVKAGISGTVTAVYAKEGESASGVIFVIEDTENLVVSSSVKAYNLDEVYEGMKVSVKTDATGDRVYYGVIESLAPAAVKDLSGAIIATNDAEFETVIAIDEEDEKLRIGVSAQIEYIIDEVSESAVVPRSAIIKEGENSYVIVASKGEDGLVTLSKTTVTPLVSNGIYTAVSGIEIGDFVMDNANNYAALVGMSLPVSDTDRFISGANDMMNMMMQASAGRM